MLPDLAQQLTLLEERKTDLLARIDALTEAERAAPILPGEWSPVQLVQHLVLVEENEDKEIEVAEARQAAGDPVPRRRGPSPFLMAGIAIMQAGIRVPVPETMVPREEGSLDALRERWAASRRALRARLEARDTETEREPLLLHPLAGALTPAEYLRFQDVHLMYHQRQYARMRRASQKAR